MELISEWVDFTDKTCHFCKVKVVSTYKQMYMKIEVWEECCDYDAGAELFFCATCKEKIWNFLAENSKESK